MEPNWEDEWSEITSSVTYAGVKLHSCSNCGDIDRNYCDCAKADWIEDRKKEYNEKINPKPANDKLLEKNITKISFRDEIVNKTKLARQRILDVEKRERLQLIAEAKSMENGLYWKICEETIWPDIQIYIKSRAEEANNGLTYQVNYKHFENYKINTVYNFIEIFIQDCLVPFIWTMGFKAKNISISGRNNGTHVEIRW